MSALAVTLIYVYMKILIVRIVIEMIHSFSRTFRPPRWFAVIAEPFFIVTEPPIRALRKIIPPLRLGGVALDMAVLVLFILLQLAAVLIKTFV